MAERPRSLVTGGAGFIGSHLVEALLRRGEHVRVLDNFSTGRRENLEQAERWAAEGGGSFELLQGDIRDAEDCRRAVRGCAYVFHQAAIPSVQRSVADPRTTHEVNVTGTLNLLLAARETRVERFVFASSSSVYGESEALPKEETTPPAPVSPYGLQKLAAETYCRLFHRLYGLPAVCLRYFNVFGPRQDPDSEYAAVIPRFIQAIRDGARPTVYGDGEQTRDFTYVANAVEANLRARAAGPEAWGQAFNVACGERTSLNGLLQELEALAGHRVERVYSQPRPGDIRHSLAAVERARKWLGFEPRVGLREGLRRTWEAWG